MAEYRTSARPSIHDEVPFPVLHLSFEPVLHANWKAGMQAVSACPARARFTHSPSVHARGVTSGSATTCDAVACATVRGRQAQRFPKTSASRLARFLQHPRFAQPPANHDHLSNPRLASLPCQPVHDALCNRPGLVISILHLPFPVLQPDRCGAPTDAFQVASAEKWEVRGSTGNLGCNRSRLDQCLRRLALETRREDLEPQPAKSSSQP
jgi:hypothetical protein